VVEMAVIRLLVQEYPVKEIVAEHMVPLLIVGHIGQVVVVVQVVMAQTAVTLVVLAQVMVE
jgi:hypothetical protein